MSSGRFAPSPTGQLHLGNLRTALVSWLWATSAGSPWHVRFEDLDAAASSVENEAGQLEDLRLLGMESAFPPVRQSDRFDFYRESIALLRNRGLLYECFCTRKEIREEIARSASAPNGPQHSLGPQHSVGLQHQGQYPGTCRTLTETQQQKFRDSGRPAALRVRSNGEVLSFEDLVCGPSEAVVDDFVIQRNDGTPAYNLAVLLDDVEQNVDLVVRGDDLLTSTPRQLWVAAQLELAAPAYAHVPLVLNDKGDRLAKRDGAVTLQDRLALGESAGDVLGWLLRSLGISGISGVGAVAVTELDEIASTFNPASIPSTVVTFPGRA